MLLESSNCYGGNRSTNFFPAGCIEYPVNAKEDSADTILVNGFFQTERLLPPGPDDSIFIGGCSVEFIGREFDFDILGGFFNQARESLKTCRTESGMA